MYLHAIRTYDYYIIKAVSCRGRNQAPHRDNAEIWVYGRYILYFHIPIYPPANEQPVDLINLNYSATESYKVSRFNYTVQSMRH